MSRIIPWILVALATLPIAYLRADEPDQVTRRELIRERDRIGEEAGHLRARGRLDEAIPLVRRMVDIERRVSGPQDPEVVVVLEYLSQLLQEKDDWAGAVDAAQQVADIWKAVEGPRHWRTITAENELVTLRTVAGRPPQDRVRFLESAHDLELTNRLRGCELHGPAEAEARRALEVREAVLGRKSFPVAACLISIAQTLLDRQRPRDALPLLTEADQTLRDVLGPAHRDRAVTLSLLGGVRRDLGELDEARRLFQQVWTMRRESTRPGNPILRATFDDLLDVYTRSAAAALDRGDVAEALALSRRQVALCEESLVADAPRTRDAVVERAHAERLAKCTPEQRRRLRQCPRQLERASKLTEQGKDVEALDLVVRTAREVDELLGAEDPLWADCYAAMSDLAQRAGQLDAAEKFASLVSDHRTAVFGAGHLRTLESLARLADVQLWRAGRLGHGGRRAERQDVLRRALDTLAKAYGEDHWRVIDCRWLLEVNGKTLMMDAPRLREYEETLTALAEAADLRKRGRPNQTAQRLRRAVAHFERQWDGRHPRYPECLMDLGVLALEQGDLAGAEPWLRRAEKEYAAILGPKHPRSAMVREELAHWHQLVADLDSAARLYQQAAQVLEQAGGQELELARCLQGLGQCYLQTGELSPAEPLLRQALAIRLPRLGRHHDDAAESWNSLGSFYSHVRTYEFAEALLRQAAAVWRENDRPLPLARCLDNLAGVLVARGDAAGAVRAAREAQKRFAGALGPDHIDSITNRFRLAECLSAAGEASEAASQAMTALNRGLDRWEQTAGALSSRQRLDMVAEFRGGLDVAVRTGLLAKAPAGSLYAAVLRYKGRALERADEDRRHARERMRAGDETMTALAGELQQADQRFAARLLVPPDTAGADRARAELAELYERRTRLEARRAEKTRGQAAPPLTPDEFARDLPPGVALIDFHHLGHGNLPGAAGDELLAFTTVRGHATQVFRLGATSPVYQAVDEWRSSLGLSEAGEIAPAAVRLRRLVWDQLPDEVLKARVVLVVPEGPLARFPWGALPGSRPGQYLIEEQLVAVLPSARVLPRILKAPTRQRPPATALLVGDVDFGEPPAGADTGRPQWSPLGGTKRELDDLEKTLSDGHVKTTVLRRSEAGVSAFRRQAGSHRVIHLATHGFFDAPDYRRLLLQATLNNPAGSFGLAFGRSFAALEPGLLSGVVLARANLLPAAADEDGLLTALELGDMDLEGVDLVTVSACESGLGDLHPAEGPLGLSRALQAAGVRTCVTTLWKIDDASTVRLMSEFYRSLTLDQVDVLEALRRAQRAVLRRSEPATVRLKRGLTPIDDQAETRVGAPYYWASFVLSGDWR